MSQDKNDQQWKGRRRDRDDTPSFIRNVDTRVQMLNPGRGQNSLIPVLEIPKSVRIWQKVRWPLLVVAVLVVLAAVGLFTNELLVSRTVEQRIQNSLMGEQSGSVQVLLESNRVLGTMAARYSGRVNVQAAYAWNSVLLAGLFDAPSPYLENSIQAFDAIESDQSTFAVAARAGLAVLKGNLSQARTRIDAGKKQYPNEPRIQLVECWLTKKQGHVDQAIAQLKKLVHKFPNYLAALYGLIDAGIASGDRQTVIRYSTELLKASTGNLYGQLTYLLGRLPGWTDEPLTADVLQEVSSEARPLTERLADVPLKMAIYGQFLFARLHMEQGRYKKAIAELEKIPKDQFNLDISAWRAKAILATQGPKAALAVLDQAGEKPGVAVLDLRARCYLELFKVKEASAALEALEGNPDFDLTELQWILAVRKGDVDGAIRHIPIIGARNQFVALELYEQLRETGNGEAINQLIQNMTGQAQDCGEALSALHKSQPERLFKYTQTKDPCVAALMLRFMNNHIRPPTLQALTSLATQKGAGNLRISVDAVNTIWKTKGRKAALARLDALQKKNSSSPPLLLAIARTYLSMGALPQAIKLASQIPSASALAIVIDGWNRQNRSNKADQILADALMNNATATHPAIVFQSLKKKFNDGQVDLIPAAVDSIMPKAGVWTAELAELKALVMNAQGERGEADRYLSSVAKQAIKNVGLPESWDTQKAIIRMNLRRGGAFLFKAVAVTVEMYKTKIDDPEVAYSYGVEFLRQGNERGALRFLNEAINIDPTFTPPYEQLKALKELSEQQQTLLSQVRPDITLN